MRAPLLATVAIAACALVCAPLHAQDSISLRRRPVAIPAREGTPFFRPSDMTVIAVASLAAIELGHFDTKIARWTQTASVQGDSSRLRLVKRFTKANETTLTAAALLAYGVGRIAHATTITDVSAHVGEALLLTNVVSQAIRGPFGRARPYVTHDENNSDFHVRKGFTSYDYRSLPSLHAASAFAAASALTAELEEHHSGMTPVVAPLLFTAALVPGFTRMYLDQHWASDVAMGAFVGTFLGAKVVHHAHGNPRNRLDRMLLGTTVQPLDHGGVALGWHSEAP